MYIVHILISFIFILMHLQFLYHLKSHVFDGCIGCHCVWWLASKFVTYALFVRKPSCKKKK